MCQAVSFIHNRPIPIIHRDLKKQCVGHKNIVEFVDSYVNCLGNGIWECMLLTEYHHKNVFQLMNERSSTNQFLTGDEIQSIFCDMCEAVSFIHNRPIPIIHRDLKVENVLISSHKPPNYVLCDFGSATTQVLSVEQHGVEYVRAEVERNTTMCYRSPEMIDLYSGQVLGLKGDLWALGVLLYRLCYFCVPFDESPLAIQSVNYQFPAFPNINDDIKVLIYMLLDVDVNRRPSIFQLSVLAFEANRKAIPREIEERRQNSEPIPSLEACLRLMRSERKPRNQKASSTSSQPAPTSSSATSSAASGAPLAPSIVMTSGVTSSGETSVQPRLRPKPTTIVPNVPSISPVPPPISMKTPSKPEESEARRPTAPSSDFHHRQSFSGEDRLKAAAETGPGGPLSCPLIKPADLGFTDLVEQFAKLVEPIPALKPGKQRRDELIPKMVSPRQTCPSIDDDDWDLGDRWTDRRDTVFERPAALAPPVPPMAFAPATLPRQVTPLSAVCKLKPDLPTAAPVSIIPSMSTTSFPEAVVRSPEDVMPREPPVGTLISVGAPTQPPSLVSLKKHEKVEKAARKEKKKEKKERKTRETAAEKGSSEMETDGSEAEMWQHDAGKKKKKSTFGLRSSHPSSIVANELRFAAPIPSNSSTTTSSSKKGTKEKKSSSAVKKSSVGSAKMASFVNTSFQPEDADGDISTDL